MATRTATGSGTTNNNNGVALGVGAAGSALITNLSLATSSEIGSGTLNKVAFPSKTNGVSSAFKSSSTTLTSVADNSGKCRFTLTSHGLTVGQVLFVSGSTAGGVDGTHKVTAVPTANTFDTDVDYVASATAGVYKTVARNFAQMETGEYLIKLVGTKIAGTADSSVKTPAGFGASNKNLKYGKGNHRYHILSWNAATGAATFGANRGDEFTYKDAAGSALAQEALPTNAVPGGLVYSFGAALPKNDQYKARTSS